MTELWRPNGWKNPYDVKMIRPEAGDAFEAGADAMLEALREMGTRAGKFIHKDGLVKETPLIVIIPDEEK